MALPADLAKLKVPELKAELSKRGLTVSGLKAVLVERLQEAIDKENRGAEAAGGTVEASEEPASVAGSAAAVPGGDASGRATDFAGKDAEPVTVLASTTEPALLEPPSALKDDIAAPHPLPSSEREDAPAPTSTEQTPIPPLPPAVATPSSPAGEARKRKRTASPEPTAPADVPPRKAPFKPSRSKSPLPPTTDIPNEAIKTPYAAETHTSPESPKLLDRGGGKLLSPTIEKPKREAFKPKREVPRPLSPPPNSDPTPAPDPPVAAEVSAVDAGPPVHPVTRALYISNLVRPFTLPQIKELVSDFGELETFWMDAVKSHAYVVYTNDSAAVEARRSLDSVAWPSGTGRPLSLVHLDPARVPALTSAEDEIKKAGRPRQDLKITHSPNSPDATSDGWVYTLVDFSVAAQRPGAPVNPASAAGRMLAVQMGGANVERARGLASAVPNSAQTVGGHIGAQARAALDRQRQDSIEDRRGTRAIPPHLDRPALDDRPGARPFDGPSRLSPTGKVQQTVTLPSLSWAPVDEAEAARRMQDYERRPPIAVAPRPEPRWGDGRAGGYGRGRGGFDGPRWSSRGDDGGWRGRGRGGGPRW